MSATIALADVPGVVRSVLAPDAVRALEPSVATSLHPEVWVYRYEDERRGWLLSVATNAEPGSGNLSLGGFRIAPESRTAAPGYDNDREAVNLAVGMEEKVYWSRVLRVYGPLAESRIDRVVGGKCVLRPTPGSRVGEPGDRDLLDFAAACLRDVDASAGIHVTTGQDLGHGTMSDGHTSSLRYLADRFEGAVVADTSRPTGEGNYQLLVGMLDACGIAPADARIVLVGAGNIGRYILGRLAGSGATITTVEASEATREALSGAGVRALAPAAKLDALSEPVDAVLVNAAGGSLDAATVAAIAANPSIRIVCGSENLAMPDPSGEARLLEARKVYAHPELGGMMGYLTAVEEYLARRAGVPFDVETLITAARRLREVGATLTRRVVDVGYAESFQDAARAVYGGGASAR